MPLYNPTLDPNEPGQINTLPNKTTPVGADEILIEDSADSYNKKKLLVSNLPADSTAIHKATAAEISVITEKTVPVAADLLLIEDSAAANAKKRVQVGNLPAGVDTTAIHKATAAEISTITEKTVPVAADLLLIEDSAAANAKKRVQLGNIPAGSSTIAEATDTITQTAATDAIAAGTGTSMTITPTAGVYLVTFSGSITNDTNGGTTYCSIWYNGLQVTSSERRYNRGGSQQQTVPFCCVARVTAAGGIAVEGRWRVSTAGNTGTMYQRNILIHKVT